MLDFDSLKFDCVEVDTTLAKEYLKNNKEFHSSSSYTEGIKESLVLDSCGNNIYCINNDIEHEKRQNTLRNELKLMATLTEKLQLNANLFAQLDYMIRGRPIEDGKIHLDLIIKQFLYWSSIETTDDPVASCNCLYMSDSSPLLFLGLAAYGLRHNTGFCIYASKQVAVVCYLLTNICHEIGIQNVHLVFREELNCDDNSMGCAGVITERSDSESALDMFLSSTVVSPWSLNQIYVQESIYKDFKELMAWKCKTKSIEDQLQHDAYEYGAKIFVLDGAIANAATTARVVRVEAYRTTKELLSLLAKREPSYVSLWASDVSEANEIAHGVNSNAVWVNDFGTFHGPAQASNAVYQDCFSNIYEREIDITASMLECCNAWAKLSFEKRHQMIVDALRNDEFLRDIDNECRKLLDSLKSELRVYRSDFVDVSKYTMCIGITKPLGMLYEKQIDANGISKTIASLRYGNTMVTRKFIYEHYRYFFDALIKSGVPVSPVNNDETCKKGLYKSTTALDTSSRKICINMKVIWTNYGTIFAN